MRLALTNEDAEIKNVDIDGSMELENLQALAEVELGIPVQNQEVYFNGQRLSDGKKSLAQYGIHQDDIVLVRRSPGAAPAAAHPAEMVRQQIIRNPQLMAQISQRNPALANLALNNPAEFYRVYDLQMNSSPATASQPNDAFADPFDIEAQKRIEDAIRKENISKNMETALEHHPESFGRVIMLYIDCAVNGHPLKAFVDSGAQATIMSPDCAQACNIMHLVDERFAGIAQGVGTAKILGRVHSAQIKVGKQYLPCSFTIMEGKGVDLLFGLDMLRRHQACIDLEKNVLRINGEEVRFLAEHELPSKARQEITASSPSTESPQTQAPSLQSTSSQPRPAAPAAAAATTFPEPIIKNLMDLGFNREQVVYALQVCNGNAELAASYLFSS